MVKITLTTSGDLNEFRRQIEASVNQALQQARRLAPRPYSRPSVPSPQLVLRQRARPRRPERAQRAARSGTALLMPLEPVHSSILAKVGYDASKQHLGVEFVSGSRCLYHGVTPAVYKMLRTSTSMGSFYNRQIKGRYPSQPA